MNQLVVNKPVVPLSKPMFTKDMEEAATQALRNEHFVLGESVFKFEEEFARYCGVKHAVSVSSGTIALQLTLQALGFKRPENVVLTTPMSFVATANAVLHANATPAFTDITEEVLFRRFLWGRTLWGGILSRSMCPRRWTGPRERWGF